MTQTATSNRPAHLALFVSDLAMGGAERSVVNLARAFHRLGHRVDLVLARKKGTLLAEVADGINIVELGTASKAAGLLGLWRNGSCPLARVVSLSASKVPAAVRCAPALIAYLRRARPNALLTSLITNNVVGLWSAAAAGTGVPVVIREDSDPSAYFATLEKPFLRALPDLARRWYPRAAAIVAVSDGVADGLVRQLGIDRARLTTIYNPVDCDRTVALSKQALMHPWYADGGPPVVVAAGRLSPEKDFPTLLKAFAAMRRNRPVRLVILGDGGQKPELEALVQSLGVEADVDLTGQVENPYAYFARSALFVSSSMFEGFGVAILEALTCGCPVVSTDCPSGPSELLDRGTYGRLVPIGDVQALADAMERTLDEPRQDHRQQSRARCFSIDTVVDRYLDLLLETRRLAEPALSRQTA